MAEVAQISSTWSENSDFWIKIIRENLDRYRTELTDARVLDAAGDVDGKTVLDVACGEGYLTRAMEGRGARAFGVDLCEELITAAREVENRPERDSHYRVADMRRLPFPDESFDLVLANHAINEVEDPALAFDEWARVLKIGGRLVCLMLHPCFFNWHTGNASYFEPHTVGEKPYVVAGITSPAVATAHTAPLESYVNGMIEAGVRLESFSEVRPSAAQVAASTWWRARNDKPKFLLLIGTRHA